MVAATAWALLWRSKNALDGETRHLVMEGFVPALFRTRAIARDYAKAQYGYIAARDDLKAEPHGWTVPQPVRVCVQLNELKAADDAEGNSDG